jgi:hypothetical protein
MTCDRCYQPSAVGTHGIGLCPLEPRRDAPSVKPDTIVGGFIAETAWREPRYFDSQRRYERALDADGMMIKPPKSRGASPITAESMERARLILERVAARTKTVPILETALDETFTVQADA